MRETLEYLFEKYFEQFEDLRRLLEEGLTASDDRINLRKEFIDILSNAIDKVLEIDKQ